MPKPVSELEFKLANKLNKKFGARMMDFADSGSTGEEPDYQIAKGIVDETNSILSQYEKQNRKVDEQGKLTAEPVTRSPSTVASVPQSGFNYHFEPSVEEVRRAFKSDPRLAVKIGLGPDWTQGIAVPEHKSDAVDTMTGEVHSDVIPAKTHLDVLDYSEDADSPYQKYASYLWDQRRSEAEAKGEGLKRYKDIHFNRQQWPDFLAGGLAYNIENRLRPAMVGAVKTMTAGIGPPALDWANRKAAEYLGVEPGPTTEDIAARNPDLALAGELGGYALPGNPANFLQEGIANIATKGLSEGGKRVLNPLTKAGVAGVAGGVTNTMEGFTGDTARALEQGEGLSESLMTGVKNAPFNTVTGLIGGSGFDLAGQAAGVGRTSLRESPMMRDLKTLESAGGRSDAILGVRKGPDMQPYITREASHSEPNKANAIAAKDLVPQFRTHMTQVAKNERAAIKDQLEEYYNHPVYGAIEVDSRPLVDELLKMAEVGRGSRGPISGKSKYPHPQQMRKIGKQLERVADVHWVPADEADILVKQHNGVIIEPELARNILDTSGAEPGYVAVAAALPINARTLTQHEEMIDQALGSARQKTTKDDPVFRGLNRAIKTMRDQFPYYVDESGKLIDPPSIPGGGTPPSGPKPPSGSTQPTVTDIDSAPAQTAPEPSTLVDAKNMVDQEPSIRPSEKATPLQSDDFVQSAEELRSDDFIPGTEQLGSDDFIQSAEELGSDDFLTRSGIELGSGDFQPATEAPKAKRARAKRAPKGPQRADYPTFNEYMEARAEWRLADAKATAADMKRLQKKAKRLGTQPETVRPQEAEPTPREAPVTQRSIAPEEETPLSVLAGNKLAMDDPFASGVNETGPFMSAPPREDWGMPTPNTKDWEASKGESQEWYEGIVSPGRDPRSSEAKRMGDLTQQQQAFDEANAQIRDVENRLGELEKEPRVRSILGIMSQKLGREVTIEDLVRAGLMGGGLAVAASGEEGTAAAGVGAMMLGGLGGKGKKGPRQLEINDNGDVYTGFSALRHKQHQALNELEKTERLTGVEADDAIVNRLIGYRQNNNPISNDALLKVARELGLEKELNNIAALTVYPGLKDRARWGLGTAHWWNPFTMGAHRGDRALQLLSGQKNPFSGGPISDASERFFDLTGGRVGARFGNDAARIYEQLKEYIPEEEEQNAAP